MRDKEYAELGCSLLDVNIKWVELPEDVLKNLETNWFSDASMSSPDWAECTMLAGMSEYWNLTLEEAIARGKGTIQSDDEFEAKVAEVRNCAPTGFYETYIDSRWPELTVGTRAMILMHALHTTEGKPHD